MRHVYRRITVNAIKVAVIAFPGLVVIGVVGTALAAPHTPSPTSSGAAAATLPPAKQALIDHMNEFRGPTDAVHPIPPGPSSTVAQSIMAQPLQPCTRSLSQIPTGLFADAPAGQDFASEAYSFNNEWMNPTGGQAVIAGNVAGTAQGAIGTETWSSPTSCAMTQAEFVAPSDSGSLTITSVSGSIVSLTSSAGSDWSFDLNSGTFSEGP
jgi:hypothetical protein